MQDLSDRLSHISARPITRRSALTLPLAFGLSDKGTRTSTAASSGTASRSDFAARGEALRERLPTLAAYAPRTHQPNVGYGLGWRLEQTVDGRAFWHSGYNDGFHSFALADPDGRFGVVVLTNSDEGHALRWPVVHGATGRGSAAILA